MGAHRLMPLLAPRSIAIVGASPKAGTVQRNIVDVLQKSCFAGALHTVNPNYKEVAGLACVPRIADLAQAPDLAILGVGAHRMEAALEDAIAGGARAVTIFDNCYLDNEAAPKLLDRLKARARSVQLPVCGGNGMGFYNFEERIFVSHYHPPVRAPGSIAYIAHSGSAFDALLFNDPRHRFNLAVSPGQEINATAADYIDYALDLASTRVIALFLEAVRDPAGFVAALAKARKKQIPVLVVKVGRTEASARLAQTHTDALVGDDAAFDAVLERYGAVRLRTLDELIAAASLLASPKAVPSGGLTVMIDSGGLRESLIDLAEERGVKLTQLGADATNLLKETLPSYLPAVNPLDIGVPLKVDRPPMVKRIWESFLADPGTAIGAFEFEVFDDFCYSPGLIDAAEEIALASPKPFLVFSTLTRARNNTVAQRFAEKGIPVINGVDNFLAAVKTAFAYRDFVPQPSILLEDNETTWSTRLQTAVPLEEAEGLAMLKDFGIPVVASRVVESSADAVFAARILGFPIAVKTANPDIAHKSDVKGVHLGLADEAAVRGAYENVASRLGPRVTIAAMASPGVELAFGAVIDPQFGPVVMAGMGGKLVEILADRVVALAPFDSSEAGRLIDRLRGRRLLDGVRGDPPCDVTAAAQALAAFSRLAAALSSEIKAIDVNPVIVGPAGAVAVDALVVTRHQKHSS